MCSSFTSFWQRTKIYRGFLQLVTGHCDEYEESCLVHARLSLSTYLGLEGLSPSLLNRILLLLKKDEKRHVPGQVNIA